MLQQIICPVALMQQWKTEIETKSDAGLTVCIHHGTGKKSGMLASVLLFLQYADSPLFLVSLISLVLASLFPPSPPLALRNHQPANSPSTTLSSPPTTPPPPNGSTPSPSARRWARARARTLRMRRVMIEPPLSRRRRGARCLGWRSGIGVSSFFGLGRERGGWRKRAGLTARFFPRSHVRLSLRHRDDLERLC